MKLKHVLITVCLLCASICTAQKNQLFDKYADMDNVTSVYISKSMMSMISSVKNKGLNLMDKVDKIESLQLVSTSNKDMIPQMKNDFSKLVTGKHEELMRIRDGKSRVTFYALQNKDLINELVMLVDDETSYVAILIVGSLTISDIQDISTQMK